MRFRIFVLSCSLSSLIWLSGCAQVDQDAKLKEEKSAKEAASAVDRSIRDSADSISESLSRIAAIGEPPKIAESAPARIDDSHFSPALRKKIDVDFEGDISTFMRWFESNGGVWVMVTGKHPPQSVVVSLHYKNTPAWKVLYDAGVQIGNYGAITIGDDAVSLEYAGAGK